jgi:hypothetical protein
VADLGDPDEGAGSFLRRLALIGVVAAVFLAAAGSTAWASTWAIVLRSGSAGESRAQAVPVAPTGITAACTSSTTRTVKVTWTAVAKATSYTVYDATTSATGTYTSVASGVTTASWTSGTLAAANYWFEVVAFTGTNWSGPKSTASPESTTTSSGCTQP